MLFSLSNILIATSALLYVIALSLSVVFTFRYISSFTTKARRIYVLVILLSFGWFGFNTLSLRAPWSNDLTLLGIRGTLTATALLTPYLALYFNNLFRSNIFFSQRAEKIILAVGATVSVVAFLPITVKSVTIGQSISPSFGLFFPVYAVWVLASASLTLYQLWRYRFIKEFSHQNKWLYIFWGFIITIGTVFVTNLLTVTIYKSDAGVVFGPSLLLIFIYICLYVMDASRVVDLGFAFDIGRRYLVSIAAVFLFLFAGYMLISAFPHLSYATLVFAAAFMVIASKVTVQYTEPYTKYEGEIKKFINRISVELDLNQILNEIKKIVIHATQVKDASFVILNRDKSLTTYTYTKKDFNTGDQLNDLFNKVNALWDKQGHDDIITAESSLLLKESANVQKVEVLRALEKSKLFLVAPLNRRVTLNGAIFLGNKANNVEFTKNDIDLLEEIIQFSSVAISRALLYQETSTFANKLKIEVKERTKELEEAQLDLQSKNIQIRNAFHELKTLDNAKSEFISIASHQLRTPISIIKGYISMIQEGDFGGVHEEQKVALKKTADNIQQLNDIVEDILNASRIERGKLAITPESTDIIELINNVVTQLQQKAQKKKLALNYFTQLHDFTTLVDKNKIYEVIMNLVDNAINYTPKGSITVTSDKTAEGDLLIAVKDTGIGIPEEFKSKMFKRFSRSDNARTVRPDGTGIGLYVAKSFIEAHHGQIWFESVENEGTTFFVKLLKSPVFDFPVKTAEKEQK